MPGSTGWLNRWLAAFPSTNGRIVSTLGIVYLTALRYLASGTQVGAWSVTAWTPSESWLLFLAGMSGLDLAQFYAKRKTQDDVARPPAPRAPDDKPDQSGA
jgi:uncharacterized protein (DUF1501 family)